MEITTTVTLVIFSLFNESLIRVFSSSDIVLPSLLVKSVFSSFKLSYMADKYKKNACLF